jgi:hypothetical protein
MLTRAVAYIYMVTTIMQDSFRSREAVDLFSHLTGFRFHPTVAGQLMKRAGLAKSEEGGDAYAGEHWPALWSAMMTLALRRCDLDAKLTPPRECGAPPLDALKAAPSDSKRLSSCVGDDWDRDSIDTRTGAMRVLLRSTGTVAVAVAWVDGQRGEPCEVWIDIDDPAGGARIVLAGEAQFESVALAIQVVHARIRQQMKDRGEGIRLESYRREPSGSCRIGGSKSAGWQFNLRDLSPGSWAHVPGYQLTHGRGEKGQFSDWLPGVQVCDEGFEVMTEAILSARQDRGCSDAHGVLDLGRSSFVLARAFKLMPGSEKDSVDVCIAETAAHVKAVRSESRRAVLSRILRFQKDVAEAIAANDTFVLRRASVPAVSRAPLPKFARQGRKPVLLIDLAPPPPPAPPVRREMDPKPVRLFRAAIPN